MPTVVAYLPGVKPIHAKLVSAMAGSEKAGAVGVCGRTEKIFLALGE